MPVSAIGQFASKNHPDPQGMSGAAIDPTAFAQQLQNSLKVVAPWELGRAVPMRAESAYERELPEAKPAEKAERPERPERRERPEKTRDDRDDRQVKAKDKDQAKDQDQAEAKDGLARPEPKKAKETQANQKPNTVQNTAEDSSAEPATAATEAALVPEAVQLVDAMAGTANAAVDPETKADFDAVYALMAGLVDPFAKVEDYVPVAPGVDGADAMLLAVASPLAGLNPMVQADAAEGEFDAAMGDALLAASEESEGRARNPLSALLAAQGQAEGIEPGQGLNPPGEPGFAAALAAQMAFTGPAAKAAQAEGFELAGFKPVAEIAQPQGPVATHVNAPAPQANVAAVEHVRPAAPPTPAEQIAIHIQKAAAQGAKRIDIALEPGELGRVEVRLDIDRQGNVTASIVAERPETLEMLQKDARGLERGLQGAGLNADQDSLSFSLRQGQDEAAAQAREGQDQRGRGQGRPGFAQGQGESGEEPVVIRPRGLNRALDIVA
ncbi:MAG: flagellar hook-length control protein FliK [Alphaproteobacteria bacterium]|nr:flagellar hook-length control protein FliK [Alphaproteobacteria bacterium]